MFTENIWMKLAIMKFIEGILVPVTRLVHYFNFITTLEGGSIIILIWKMKLRSRDWLTCPWSYCLHIAWKWKLRNCMLSALKSSIVARQFSATFPPSCWLIPFFTIDPKQKNVNNHSKTNHEPSAVTDSLSENNKLSPCSPISSRNFSGLKVLV